MGVTVGCNSSASMNVKQPSINIIISGAKPSAGYSRKSISAWPISKEDMGLASSSMYMYVYFRLANQQGAHGIRIKLYVYVSVF